MLSKLFTRIPSALFDLKEEFGAFLSPWLRESIKDISGSTSIEYALTVGTVGFAIVGLVFLIGDNAAAAFQAADIELCQRLSTIWAMFTLTKQAAIPI